MVLATQRVGVENVLVAGGNAEARERADRFAEPLRREGVLFKQFPTLPWPREAPDRWGLSYQQSSWVMRHVADYDLLHIHGIWGVGLLGGLAAARWRGVPVVVTAHEALTAFDIDDSRSEARRRQKLALRALYLRWATMFVLTSELEATDSLPPSESARLRVIHYPLVDPRQPVPPLHPRGTHTELRVGVIGRIHPKKNVGVLVEALAQLPEHVRLVVAGDARHGFVDLPDRLRERAAALGVDHRVEWLGFVSPEDRGELVDSLDLVAMPSVFESFGMSAAEAMLQGVPVLVSQRTGIAEVIARRGGGTVASADPAGVAEAIRKLDDDREALGRLGREAQAAILAELTYTQVGQALEAAYAEALALGSGRRGRRGFRRRAQASSR